MLTMAHRMVGMKAFLIFILILSYFLFIFCNEDVTFIISKNKASKSHNEPGVRRAQSMSPPLFLPVVSPGANHLIL